MPRSHIVHPICHGSIFFTTEKKFSTLSARPTDGRLTPAAGFSRRETSPPGQPPCPPRSTSAARVISDFPRSISAAEKIPYLPPYRLRRRKKKRSTITARLTAITPTSGPIGVSSPVLTFPASPEVVLLPTEPGDAVLFDLRNCPKLYCRFRFRRL